MAASVVVASFGPGVASMLRRLILTTRRAPLPTAVPNASVVELMGLERAPVATYAPRSVAATAFRNLWQDIAQRIWT